MPMSLERTISVETIGRERQQVAIIDNFSPEADALTKAATGAAFEERGEYYPGPRAPAPKTWFAGIRDVVVPIARDVFGGEHTLRFERALFSLATRAPQTLSLAQRVPHIDDVDSGALAIVHYLSAQDFGGTAFFRHRSTGFETVTRERHELFLSTLKADFVRHGEPPAAYISGDTPIFERIFSVAPVFNRAVIYRSSLLHCAELPNEIPLPADSGRGRLTIAAFLRLT